MTKTISGLVALAVITVTSVASAQVTLQPIVRPNDNWKLQNVVKTHQVLTVGGQELETRVEQVIEASKMSGPRGADGTVKVRTKMDSVKADLTLPGGVQLNYDSTNPDAAPPGTQFDDILTLLAATSKGDWTMVHGRDGRVISVSGQEKVLEGLEATLAGMIKKQLESEYLIEQANNELDRLPPGPVRVGDSWKRTNNFRIEGGQNLTLETQYTYIGSEQRNGRTLDKIGTKGLSVSYSIDDDALLRATGSDLKISESEGWLLFDRGLGQVVQSRDKMRIVGTIDLVAPGRELPGSKLELEIENNLKRL